MNAIDAAKKAGPGGMISRCVNGRYQSYYIDQDGNPRDWNCGHPPKFALSIDGWTALPRKTKSDQCEEPLRQMAADLEPLRHDAAEWKKSASSYVEQRVLCVVADYFAETTKEE